MCEENKRKEVYDFIVDFVSENLFPPSYKHIAKSLGIKSTETVSSYLQDLQMLGKIKLVKNGKMDTKIKLLGYKLVKEEKEEKVSIDDAISHFNYGLSHDIFSEPVSSYAELAVVALKELKDRTNKKI